MKKKLHNTNFKDYNFSRFFGAKLLLLLLICSFSLQANAQLSDFTLQITKTDETCPGNGTLNFITTNTTPGATLNYRVYKLPNLVNEIASISANFIGGLSNGTYQIVATQTLSSDFNTQTQEITISNALVPFDISLSSTNAICGNDATITANITSGTAVSYEIISGPVTRPIQTSNIFTALPAGTYQVRVYDNCGEALVETRAVFTTTPEMTIRPIMFPDIELPGCNLITVTHEIYSNNSSIHYPIQYEFTIYPPDNSAPVIIPGVLTSGDPQLWAIYEIIPFYYDQIYSYDLKVTDYCGLIYNVNNNIINQKINLLIAPREADCNNYFLDVQLTKYRGPTTINFTQSPPGFDPIVYNPLFTGILTSSEITFGDETNYVPMGDYTIEITDACGRTTSQSITIEYVELQPTINATQTGGCASTTGNIKIKLPNREFTTATIISAPIEYTGALPQNIANFIVPNDGLQFNNVPAGTYIFILYDTCGYEYTVEATIVNSTNNEVGFNSRPDCEIGKGSVRIRAAANGLVSVIITTAPAGFSQTLPFDVSAEIGTNGNFTMNNLIPGNYTFNTINGCGSAKTLFITVTGYSVTTDEFELFQHCGSFDFFFNHISNSLAGQSFWLQKLDPVTNTWGHPQTNVAYTENMLPNPENSLPLTNNTTLYNLTYTGTFRILKRFETFDNGSISELKNCLITLKEFDYLGILKIDGLESLTCNGEISDVRVLIDGVPPFVFKIIEKNGQPFFIDNGNNPIFTNLDPAVYKFEVSDGCGVIRTYEFDVALLPPPVFANQPYDFVVCDDSSDDGIENFTLSTLNSQILGNQSPTTYSVSYYETASDANSEINALPENYSSGNQQIFARVNHPTNLDCFAITDFNLEVKEYPLLNLDRNFSFCENSTITITADPGYNSYVWSDGQIGNTATFDQPGIYTLTFTKEYENTLCTATHQIEIKQSNAPKINQITVTDWTDSNNTISVFLENGIGDYEYSIDNINFQSENTFYELQTGPYTVYVKDKNGCGPDAEEAAFLLTYPKFFTPNADGYNDFWRIKFSMMEPNMIVYIFDRYGKLITGFGANDPGWDGTLNGYALPSTDYWFLVKRENGKEHRGHFAMKR